MDLQQRVAAMGAPEAGARTPLSSTTRTPARIDAGAGSDQELLAMRQHLCWRNIKESISCLWALHLDVWGPV